MNKLRIYFPTSFLVKIGALVLATGSIIIFTHFFLHENEAEKIKRTKSERDNLQEWVLQVDNLKTLDYSKRVKALNSLQSIVDYILEKVENVSKIEVNRPPQQLDRQRMLALIGSVTKELNEGKTIRKINWYDYRQKIVSRLQQVLGAYRNWQIKS